MLRGREIEQWHDLKEIVTNTIMQHNGSVVSHHHSVGLDHQNGIKIYR